MQLGAIPAIVWKSWKNTKPLSKTVGSGRDSNQINPTSLLSFNLNNVHSILVALLRISRVQL